MAKKKRVIIITSTGQYFMASSCVAVAVDPANHALIQRMDQSQRALLADNLPKPPGQAWEMPWLFTLNGLQSQRTEIEKELERRADENSSP